MDSDQILQAARKYAQQLQTFEARRHPTAAIAPSTENAMCHLRWMCEQVESFVGSGKLEKANRWLGFIQGVLWLSGRGSVDAFREDNRDARGCPEG